METKFDIEEELKKLPEKPGVYIMHDKADNVIYVGKAIVLRNRVRQYFRKNNKTARIERMVSLIDHFEYIVVENEDEALILECNLIKKYRPKFNVLLKDDKTYPYIKVDVKSDYPGVFMTRRIINDGAKYYGPYPNVNAAKEMVSFIKDKFQISIRDGNGTPAVGAVVKITFGKQTFDLATNSKGIVSLDTKDLNVGKYTIKAACNSLSTSKKITVKPLLVTKNI